MDIFLTIDETVNLLGISKSLIQRNRRAGKYVTRELTGRGGKRYEIALTSLPQEAQRRYHEAVFNQEVEKIYEQKNTTAGQSNTGNNQRAGNSVLSTVAHADSQAIADFDGNAGTRGQPLLETRGKLRRRSAPVGRAATATGNVNGDDANRAATSDGISAIRRSNGELGINSRGQDVGAVSNVSDAQLNSAYNTNTKQRQCDLAIQVIFTFLENFDGSEAAAIRHINQGYAEGTLPEKLVVALDNSKHKKKPNAAPLSRRTLANWRERKAKTGSFVPKVRQPDMSIKPWYIAAIELYGVGQKPTLTYVEEKLKELYGEAAPEYGQIRDFFNNKYSQIDILKGRHTGMAFKAKGFYQKRTHAGMFPWDEVHADGWNTHFTAPHPVTGDYVTFEIWDFHDVATRYVPPFAIGMSECFEVIAKGIENAIREGGVMAILQTDSTKIVKNNAKFSGNPLVSISDRAGITIVHPKKVGNAHANGIAENFHAQLDKWSRELVTYQAQGTKHDTGMDSLTLRRTQKLTKALVKAKSTNDAQKVDELRREIAKTGKGIFFESYQQAVDWLESKRQKFNNTPHSALKKVPDDVTGKMRHQTPQEALNEFKANGWQPVAMDEAHILDLFRPRVQLKVRQCVVKPYGQMRFRHTDLDHYEGKDVVVSYDIMDYEKVWVYDLKGSLIAVAPYCADTPYRAQTAQEAAEVKRALAQIKRKESQIETIKEQRLGGLMLEQQEADVIPMRRVPIQAETVEKDEAPQLSRAEMLSQLATWGSVEDEDDDNNQPKEERR